MHEDNDKNEASGWGRWNEKMTELGFDPFLERVDSKKRGEEMCEAWTSEPSEPFEGVASIYVPVAEKEPLKWKFTTYGVDLDTEIPGDYTFASVAFSVAFDYALKYDKVAKGAKVLELVKGSDTDDIIYKAADLLFSPDLNRETDMDVSIFRGSVSCMHEKMSLGTKKMLYDIKIDGPHVHYIEDGTKDWYTRYVLGIPSNWKTYTHMFPPSTLPKKRKRRPPERLRSGDFVLGK